MPRHRYTGAPAPSWRGVWYHGDAVRRGTFSDQRMDREHDQDPNAVGPGIYWTRHEAQARGYAWPAGFIYTATMVTSDAHVLVEAAPARAALLGRAIDKAPSDSRDTGLTNYDANPMRARALAVEGYMRAAANLHDALLGLYNDFYGRDAEAFARVLVELGFDAMVHVLPAVDHLIVWNPAIIQVTREQPYEATS